MDLSSFLFVALAVVWAVYLVPKVRRHREEMVLNRPVDDFSRSMRVVARREPVDERNARLVVPQRAGERVPAADAAPREQAATTPRPSPAARRAAARRAVQRRRRVLGSILAITTVVTVLAATSVIAWAWTAAPVTLLVAWLVACRLMVKSERATSVRLVTAPAAKATSVAAPGVDDDTDVFAPVPHPVVDEITLNPEVLATSGLFDAPAATTGEIARIGASLVEDGQGLWDPVPTTLPTYVSKPAAARRTVQTIDLESTGVWTSGRTEIDAALARGAERAERAEKVATAQAAQRKVSGA